MPIISADNLDKLWRTNLDLVKSYFRRRNQYESLVNEVILILSRELDAAGVKLSSIKGRVKELDSILKKVDHKKYEDPFRDMTDIAGVRIICLYLPDLTKIKRLIGRNLKVMEESRGFADEDDRFGYQSLHYIVTLGDKHKGLHYEGLEDIPCEVQVRTILQNVWAEVSHHLIYKRESDVPAELRRRVNSLAAVLENADNQFADVANRRDRYIKRLSSKGTGLATLLDEPINSDSLRAFLNKRFPKLDLEAFPGHLQVALRHLNAEAFKTLRDLDEALVKTSSARRKYSVDARDKVACAHMALALGCVDADYRERTTFGREAGIVFKEYDK